MQRRELFKLGATAALALGMPTLALAKKDSKRDKEKREKDGPIFKRKRKFKVSLKHKILEQGDLTRLWVPLPFFREYQYLVSDINFSGNCTNAYISNTKIPTLYAEYNKVKNPSLDIDFSIVTTERHTNFEAVKFNKNEKIPKEIQEYLKPTEHIQIDGIVKKTALEILKDLKKADDLQKARALFDWTAKNMQRDESIIGCGVGDAKAILESKKLFGKCTDISSVFVALCRSVGIPAREVFGIRLGQSRFSNAMGSAKDRIANITGAQHCRAEVYIKGYGFIPCDPGDVAKVKLAENLSNDDPKIVALRDYLFGNWEMCWMGFNEGRDFNLTPKPEQTPLNNFGYPYAEVDGNALNYYDAKTFSYSYTSEEEIKEFMQGKRA